MKLSPQKTWVYLIVFITFLNIATPKFYSHYKHRLHKGPDEEDIYPAYTSFLIRPTNRLTDWQKHLPDKWQLNEIALPGTHASLSYVIQEETDRTQNSYLIDQLNAGARFIDIRWCLGISNRKTHLNVLDICYNSQHPFKTEYTFYHALGTLHSFLSENPTEFVFLRIKNERQENSAKFSEGLDLIFDKFYETFPTGKSVFYVGHNIPPPLVKDIRGKIILSTYHCDCPILLPNCLEWKDTKLLKFITPTKSKTESGLKEAIQKADNDCKSKAYDKEMRKGQTYYYISEFNGKLWFKDSNFLVAKKMNPLTDTLVCSRGIYLLDFPGLDSFDRVIKLNPDVKSIVSELQAKETKEKEEKWHHEKGLKEEEERQKKWKNEQEDQEEIAKYNSKLSEKKQALKDFKMKMRENIDSNGRIKNVFDIPFLPGKNFDKYFDEYGEIPKEKKKKMKKQGEY